MLFGPLAKRFRRNERGATAMVFALSIFVLLGMSGAAIDFARWHDAHGVSETAIDAALLAGARRMQVSPGESQAAIDAAQSYYTSKTSTYSGIVDDTVKFVLDSNGAAIRATGTSYLKTSMLGLLGIERLQIASPAKAAFPKGGGSNVEVSLMLDFTGSMCDDGEGPCASSTNVDALKDAASDFVNILIPDAPSAQTTRVALVPFATRVRLASTDDGVLMKKVTNLDRLWSGWQNECITSTGGGGDGEAAGNWTCTQTQVSQMTDWVVRPCVTERTYGGNGNPTDTVDYTDAPPGPGKWVNGHGGNRDPKSWDGTDTSISPVPGSDAATPSGQWNYHPATGWCHDDWSVNNSVVPLSSDKALLKSRIAAFEAAGGTAGVVGTQWAYYTLSPKWGSVWGGGSEPGNYADLTTMNANGVPVLRKIAILMTDGVYNAFLTGKEQNAVQVSDHAKGVCSNMKAQGIEIYTVGFSINLLQAADAATADNLLKSCATDLGHYYSPSTVNGLKAAFRDIAMKVNPVHLTQ